MTGKISLGPIRFDAEFKTEDPQLQQAIEKLFRNEAEQIEAALAATVQAEICRLFPGVTVKLSRIQEEDSE